MANKLGRNYLLSVQLDPTSTDRIEIQPPFTLEFDIVKNTFGSGNEASFRIYNLSKDTRGDLRFDSTNIGVNRNVTMYAGYGDKLSLIFSGNMTQAYSVREGNNFITQIFSRDCGLAVSNSQSSITISSGTARKQILETLIKSLNVPAYGNVTVGTIGNNFTDVNLRGTSMSGNTVDIINDLSGNGLSFDNGKAYVLDDGECIQGDFELINASTGLLGTPWLENFFVRLQMLFEPRVLMNQLITLDSITADSDFSKQYKVISVKHRGMISDAVCGDAITELTLSSGQGSLSVVGLGV